MNTNTDPQTLLNNPDTLRNLLLAYADKVSELETEVENLKKQKDAQRSQCQPGEQGKEEEDFTEEEWMMLRVLRKAVAACEALGVRPSVSGRVPLPVSGVNPPTSSP